MTDKIRISNMIRQTASDTNDFYAKVAEHIDQLEETIEVLKNKLDEQNKLLNAEVDDLK